MDSKMIEALKENERPFGLMTDEMQAAAKELGESQFEVFIARWRRLQHDNEGWDSDNTYRLHSGYTSAPDLIECEVFKSGNILHCNVPNDGNRTLEKAIIYSNFYGFKYENEDVCVSPIRYALKGRHRTLTTMAKYIGKEIEIERPTHVLFRRSE